MNQALFRQQALDRRNEGLRGELILTQPLSHRLFTLFLAGLTLIAVTFLVRHDYERKQTVPGVLVPDRGLIEVRAPATGRLAQLLVELDTFVEAGTPLFTLQLDHTLAGPVALTELLRDELLVQEAALHAQLGSENARQAELMREFAVRATSLNRELLELDALAHNERQLLEVKSAALARATGLRDRALLAPADHDAVRGQYLQQQTAVGRLRVQQEQTRAELAALSANHHAAQLGAERERQRLRAELAELQKQQVRLSAEQGTTVVAPVRGHVGSVQVRQGMSVAVQEPVLTLLPEGALLQAELWLPSSASGFVNPGQRVNLRYEAFPYQKFGVQQARVSEIAESAVTRQSGAPPLFRALATLERQELPAYGKARPLRPGMALSADIVVDERSLLEWLLEPLLSIKGKLWNTD